MLDDFKPMRPNQNIPKTPPQLPPNPSAQPANGGTTPAAAPPNIMSANSTRHRRLRMPQLSRKQWLIGALVAVVVIAGAAGAWWKFIHQAPAPPTPVAKVELPPPPPKPTTEASRLTGVQVAPELALLAITGVMIENSPDARPQSGLKDAGVVFEAIAEGGITRFLALYGETKPDYIGPVRSARPYYIDWLLGFDASYGHVGGSPEALAKIKSLGVKDLDQFVNAAAYQRVTQRFAPHNVYTSRAKLLELAQGKGYTTSTFTGFLRKADKASPAPNAKSIDIALSSFLYNTHYDYDVATNSYNRSEGGKPHIDEKANAVISPKVVVAMVMPFSIASDRVHSVYGTIGSGKAYFFQDGTVTEGIWEKTEAKSALRFGDANGSPLALNVGQTWVTAVKGPTDVSFRP